MKILFSICCAFFYIGTMHSQFSAQKIIDNLSPVPRYVTAADINNDGAIDVVAAIDGLDSNLWYENLANTGSFAAGAITNNTAIQDLRFVTTADIDGDGNIDILSSSPSEDIVVWNKNDGMGVFGSNQIIATDALEAIATQAGDLDGDGDTDVLSANRGDDTLVWYENLDGFGSFSTRIVIDGAIFNPRFIQVADVDGDLDNDVIAVSSGLSRVFWYENLDGLGTFGAGNMLMGLADGSQSIHAVDIDGDSDVDIVVAATTGNRLSWYENTDGFGSYGVEQVIDIRASLTQSVYSIDLDNDTDIDVMSITTDGEVAWYENTDGQGSFTTAQIISLDADNGRSVYAADLDGDGDNDILTASITGNKIAWYENLTILGVSENQLQATIVYPNPTQNMFQIETTAAIKSIQLYNSAGQKISVVIKQNNKVDCSQLSAGVYTVVIEDNMGHTVTEKLIKQ